MTDQLNAPVMIVSIINLINLRDGAARRRRRTGESSAASTSTCRRAIP
jgi:hypothetical protein